jgi:hypothetical protein
VTEACYAETCLGIALGGAPEFGGARSYAKSEHSLQYDFAVRSVPLRFSDPSGDSNNSWALIRFNLIKVEPQNPAELSFWRETCSEVNLAALIRS